MSKLIDKLNQVSRTMPPIGFKALPASQPQPKLLLIASLAQADFDGVADYVAGADAGLLHFSEPALGVETIKQVLRVVSDIPWGGWLRDVSPEEITRIVAAGCDFVVFPARSVAQALLQDDSVGKILEVEMTLSEGLLAAVDKLPVDAVIIGGEPEYLLTWQHLMHLQRCADRLSKPVLASIPLEVTANELQALWGAGIDGVVVELGVGQPADKLMALHRVIDGLALPPQRRRGKPAALLPYTARSVDRVTEEPEE